MVIPHKVLFYYIQIKLIKMRSWQVQEKHVIKSQSGVDFTLYLFHVLITTLGTILKLLYTFVVAIMIVDHMGPQTTSLYFKEHSFIALHNVSSIENITEQKRPRRGGMGRRTLQSCFSCVIWLLYRSKIAILRKRKLAENLSTKVDYHLHKS